MIYAPPLLEELGLDGALSLYRDRLAAIWGGQAAEIHLDLQDLPPLSPIQQEVCFRVVQEAVVNALRHGRPRRVSVHAPPRADSVVLTITDDGVGFVVAANATTWVATGHLGIASMQERAALINGRIEIQSLAGKGTAVTLVAPVDPRATSGPAPEHKRGNYG